MKRTLLFLVPLIVVAVLVAYFMYNKPHQNIQKASVDETISASALLDAYEKDETAANEQFLDKVIAVEGIVRDKSTNDDGQVQINLETGDPLASVTCTMDHLSEHEGLEAIQKGDKVTLKGICTGMLMDVIIDRCVLIK